MKDRRVSLADFVYERIEADILAESYKPGQVLTELAVSDTLEVSRTPVREAFRRLQQQGYLSETGKGSVVVGTTPRDMMDIYEIRLRTEGLATRWAARRIAEDGLRQLREALELQEFYTAKADAGHIQEQDASFHRLIFLQCGSPVLGDMLTVLHRRIQRFRQQSVKDHARADLVVAEHRAIFNALAAGDADAAEQLALAHVKNAREHIGAEECVWA